MHCNVCGNVVRKTDVFCGNCGGKVIINPSVSNAKDNSTLDNQTTFAGAFISVICVVFDS